MCVLKVGKHGIQERKELQDEWNGLEWGRKIEHDNNQQTSCHQWMSRHL